MSGADLKGAGLADRYGRHHDAAGPVPSVCTLCGRDLPAVDVISPAAVLRRARERLVGGSVMLARDAIGTESAFTAVHGGPLTKAWGILLDAYGEPREVEGFCRYYEISMHGPNLEGEMAVLDKAIAIAERRSDR
jgi:hypothetical protein